MQRWTNFLQGSVRVEVTGAFPERFFNLCAQEGILFWALEWPDSHTLRMHVPRRQAKKLTPIGKRTQCQVTVLTRSGIPALLGQVRHRYALLLGLALSLCAVGILSQFILTVDVQGNEEVPAQQILEVMRSLGVRPGTYGPSLEINLICSEALQQLPDLVWVSVNLHGTHAEIQVRERVPAPEIEDESVPTHVVADAPGVITGMEIRSGQAMFQIGDTVNEGDILLNGIVDLVEPVYLQTDLGTITVHAAGNIYAQTVRTLTAEMPLQADMKEYTGQKTTHWSILFFSHRLQIYKNGGISYERYDKISNTYQLTLPGGIQFPIILTREVMREYGTGAAQIDTEVGATMLQGSLQTRLEELMQERDGEIISTDFSQAEQDGFLVVTLTAKCREQIGRSVEFEGQLGRNQAGQADLE